MRSWVSMASGFVWSTTCESSPRPKKYSMAAEMLFGLTRLRGVMSSTSLRLIRSCTVRRSFRNPLRISSQANSSMVRRRRLPRWSMSSNLDLRIVPPQAEEIIHRGDEILRPERHLRLRDIQPQLAVDAEAAHAAQTIAVGVEELFMEEGPGLLQLRRVARPQPLVNPQQRFPRGCRSDRRPGRSAAGVASDRPSLRPTSIRKSRWFRRRSSRSSGRPRQ